MRAHLEDRLDHPIKFVITAALKQELPLDLLKSWGIEIVSARALASGILDSPGFRPKTSALAVITGVGPQRSKEAADQIIRHLKPLFVLNLGSCGMSPGEDRSSALFPGSVLLPGRFVLEGGSTIEAEAELPFCIHPSIDVMKGAALETRSEPLLGPDAGRGRRFVDMEAAVQARAFKEAAVPFYSVKVVSDLCSTPFQYQENLPLVRKGISSLLEGLLPAAAEDPPMRPEISVVIPVRNRADMVIRAVRSVLSQTLPPREVIVVDDCSSDDTVRAVRRQFGPGVRLIELESPGGVSRARNAGIAEAASSWIALLDSDDQWEPKMLESLWGYLLKNPFFQILQCEEIWIRNGRRVNRRRYHEKREGWIWDISLHRCMISPSAVMFKKAVFQRFGPFDETFPACEDYDLWLRITRWMPVGLDPNPGLIKYGGHEDQLSRSVPVLDHWRVKALKKALKGERDRERRRAIAAVMERRLAILINGAEKRGRKGASRQYRQILAELEPDLSC